MSGLIKIAFVGAGGTGKTTLINDLALKFGSGGVMYVNEAGREYFMSNPQIPEIDRFSYMTQLAIQELQWQKEKHAVAKHPRQIICDRSVLCAPAFVFSTGDISGAERLYDRIRTWVPTYDHLFLLDPNGVEFIADEVRTGGSIMREHLHASFIEFFMTHSIKYTLLTGSRQERLGIVSKIAGF